MSLTVYKNPQFVIDLKRQDQLSGFMCILGFGTSTPSAKFGCGGDSDPFLTDTIIKTEPTSTSVTFQVSMRVTESPDENVVSKYHEAYLYYVNHDRRPGLTLQKLREDENNPLDFPIQVRKDNVAFKLHWTDEDFLFMINEIVDITLDLSDTYSNVYRMNSEKFECLNASKHYDVEHINKQWYGEQVNRELISNETACTLTRNRIETKKSEDLKGSIYYDTNGLIQFKL